MDKITSNNSNVTSSTAKATGNNVAKQVQIKVVNQTQSSQSIGIKTGKNLIDCVKNGPEFIKTAKALINKDRTAVEHAMHYFNNNSSYSFLVMLDKYSNVEGASEIKKYVQSLTSKSSFIDNEFIAYDLVKTLNGSDTTAIDDAANKLNSRTVRHVYSAYPQMTESVGEKRFQGNYFTATRREMTGGANPECLTQGFLNNKTLTNEQKKEYLNKIIDSIIHSKEVKNKSAANELDSKRDALIQDALKYKNSFYIEKYVSKIYGWQ